jgi:hypothetical protein
MEAKREKSAHFWESMRKSAELARSLPSWAQAGINLNERNFITFRTSEQGFRLEKEEQHPSPSQP